LREIALRATSTNPDERFETVTHLAAASRSAIGPTPTQT
jgi:hypothetical protein